MNARVSRNCAPLTPPRTSMSGPEIAPSNLLGLAIRHERPPPWAELHPTLPRALGPLFLPRWEGPPGVRGMARYVAEWGCSLLPAIGPVSAAIRPGTPSFVAFLPGRGAPLSAAIPAETVPNRPETSRNHSGVFSSLTPGPPKVDGGTFPPTRHRNGGSGPRPGRRFPFPGPKLAPDSRHTWEFQVHPTPRYQAN